ncbi:hypothetical protein WN944_001091 [Citrus x changshan-huyou]|uniref:GIY-YIG domain-containing protein n=1 Tax=Citrus x changshan-huyou TaxID=2935761 RepID=A0AAP0MKC3_9ROSI
MEAALLAIIARIHREDCERTNHDSQFSKWKELVGLSDWENHSHGKEGAERYKVHNLPNDTGPGLYELGIAVPGAGVIVVYVGQAESVRARLQAYGRTGAHLNSGSDSGRYFEDIFRRGYSIVYRSAPMKNKEDAEKTERKILDKFDYAWNKGNNGKRRHADVRRKLDEVASNNIQFPKTIRNLLRFNHWPADIKINASPEGHNFLPPIIKFTKSQPRLVLDRYGADEGHTGICGVSLGDGSVCQMPPVEQRKRCIEHRGMRIRASTLTMKGKAKVCDVDPTKQPMVAQKCSVSEGEEQNRRKNCGSNSKSTGSSQYGHDAYVDSNVSGTLNSPEMYRQGRVQSKAKLQYDTICGVELGGGTFCTRQPVKGRVRCEQHKGWKIQGAKSTSVAQDHKSDVYGTSYGSFVCGAQTLDGSYCRRQVKANTKCWQHSDKSLTIRSWSDWNCGGSSLCGAPTRNGSRCRRPVKGGGRCWQH